MPELAPTDEAVRSANAPLLRVEGLDVRFETMTGSVHAVRGASFSLAPGETLGVVGESGSGKSAMAQAIIGLIPEATVTGRAVFDDSDLLKLSTEQLRQIRGRRISMVFQDPLSSLHPLYRVGTQIVEAIRVHREVSHDDARARAVELLDLVGIPSPQKRIDDYPHQFSGGMRQRVMIAMAIALDPALIIADEPTTALDATVQAQVLELLVRLQRELGTSLILITHDLGVVADLADQVLVMYAGRPVEKADRRTVYYQPHHPYTSGLLRSIPVPGRQGRLPAIAGSPPNMLQDPIGCAFAPRCPRAFESCVEDPQLKVIPGAAGHESACWLPVSEAVGSTEDAASKAAAVSGGTASVSVVGTRPADASKLAEQAPLMDLRQLVKEFPLAREKLLSRAERPVVHALDGIDLSVFPGETLGLVGETGCGKSTLARCMSALHEPTAGQISFAGREITTMRGSELRKLRREVQIVFQDPYGSLNPRRRVGAIIGEPLQIHRIGPKAGRRKRVQELMDLVGLNPAHFERFPAEFSGGQRQRVGIARALAVEPKLLICDEPVSALDVSVQAQVINLIQDLRDELGLTTVFISHDLSVVEHVSDRVAVMYLGRIVEIAPAQTLYKSPRHPYSAALLSAAAIPDPDRARTRERIVLGGDVPSPVAPPAGCRFHTRCPRSQDICLAVEPQLTEVASEAGRTVACHFPLDLDVKL